MNGCMSVNKSLTFINDNCEEEQRRKSSLDKSDKSLCNSVELHKEATSLIGYAL